MAPEAQTQAERFDPASFSAFRFVSCELGLDGEIVLRYALDDAVYFEERVTVPVPDEVAPERWGAARSLTGLLHLVAGVSYFKTAAPRNLSLGVPGPSPAVARLLDQLYSLGLGEFAYINGLEGVPEVAFPADGGAAPVVLPPSTAALVPVGGGKDSVVAFEAMRAHGTQPTLFSVGDPAPIRETARVSGFARLVATRRVSPNLPGLNDSGALNGHVPVTAIVSCIAAVTAVLNGCGRIVMANERSASEGNFAWRGAQVNHQWSKGLEAERLLQEALAELVPGLEYFSLLRGASELAIARSFARLPAYHGEFTSCNSVFRIDEERRGAGWCGRCPKCRFVYLALAPFMGRDALRAVFGRDLLDEAEQYDGFAALAGVEAHKPFECVGETEEAVAAFRMLAAQPEWSRAAIVARFTSEVLASLGPGVGDPARVLELSGEHAVPQDLLPAVHAALGA
ncbi:MAG: hypothetical protein WKF29_03640 [Thermoleophilaceae bacterium]